MNDLTVTLQQGAIHRHLWYLHMHKGPVGFSVELTAEDLQRLEAEVAPALAEVSAEQALAASGQATVGEDFA